MSKNVLLLHVCCSRPKLGRYIFTHALGLNSICNELNKNCINAQIVNFIIEKMVDKTFSIIEYIRQNNFKIVFLSLHWFHQLKDTLDFARIIKKAFPDIIIVIGGYTASCFYKDIIVKFPFVDYIIKGEGEKPAVQLCLYIFDNKIKLEDIPNLVYLNKQKKIQKNKKQWIASSKELDNFDYSIYCIKNFNYYIEHFNKFYVCLGRGCSGNCFWCGGGRNATKIISGRETISIRSANIAAEEIFDLYTYNNNINFYIGFDPYPNNQKYLINLIKLIGKKYPKKITLIVECWGLPTKELIDVYYENLSSKSLIKISPDFAQEKLRKRFKSFYFSNKDFYKILTYMNEKDIKSELYFVKLNPLDYNNEINIQSEMINFLRNNYKSIMDIYACPPDIYDPYSPVTLKPNKYKVKVHEMNFDLYYNL